MTNEKLLQAIRETNPWRDSTWNVEIQDRSIFDEITPYINLKQIIAISGLRRVGKTFLLFHIIKNLLKTTQPENILYFSFDDFENIEITTVLDAYAAIHKKMPEYLFLDEVQKIENWSEKIKRIYDIHKIKIFVSGSESLFVRKKTKETLAGRIFEFHLKPLSFKEYLIFKGFHKNPAMYRKELLILFDHYLLTAGFPELISIHDKLIIRKYIKEIVMEKVIFTDIPKMFKIEDPSLLKTILDIITDSPGLIIELDNLSRELGLARQTLSKYLYYLEVAQLVKKVYNYSKNRSTSEKKLKKYYLTFPCTCLIFKEDESYLSKVIENLIVISTNADYFWRTPQKDEVDIILEEYNKPIPIEVKYSSKINMQTDLAGVRKFMEKYALKKAFVITKETSKDLEDIKLIPLLDFLLGVSKNELSNPKALAN
ncbi:ATP-binding protein [Candidatus Woesearchaeota archaeon]|nr:ATP-binding protein [Candidatus Woesearchaeota archaeon]